MTHSFTTADGLRLAYDDQGSGHPLLCLAGLTRNMADFNSVTEHFAADARILRLDSRGRGASDSDPTYANYTVLQEAQDALALLDHLGLEQVSILGTSRGGLIAMTIAAIAPERLSGAILNDIGPVVDTGGISDIMAYIGRTPSWRDYTHATERLPEIMAPAGFANVAPDTWRAHAEALYAETGTGLALRYDPAIRDALIAQSTGGELPEIWPMFDALAPRPLALIRGANSNLLSPATTAEMQRRRPDILHAEIPDRGHVPFLDEPDAVDLITAYLEKFA